MAILTKSGRVVIAESILLRSIHVAWGSGDGTWISPPAESPDATALMAEVGRRTATSAVYVTPDAAGTIVLPGGAKFSISGTPTNSVMVTADFDFADAPSSVIREFAVFVGGTIIGGLPGGQNYFIPAEVATPGRLLHIENIQPIFRSPAIRETFKTVVTL